MKVIYNAMKSCSYTFLLALACMVNLTACSEDPFEEQKGKDKTENKNNGNDEDEEEPGGTWIDCYYCNDMPDGECSFCQGDGIMGGSKVCDECGGSGICSYCGGAGERYVEW